MMISILNKPQDILDSFPAIDFLGPLALWRRGWI